MMSPSDVQWMPAIAVLGGGLVLGTAGLLRLRGSMSASARAGLRGFLWATGGAAGAGLLLFLVAEGTRPGESGDTATETTVAAGSFGPVAAASASPGSEEATVKLALDRNPEDLEARLELARLRLDQQDFMAVWAETQKVLQRSAGNPRALTYQSQVRLAMGQPDVALAMLKEALAKDPGLLQAYVYVSYVHLRVGQTRQAQDAVNEAKRRFPGQAAVLDGGFARMKASLANDVPMTMGEGNPHGGLTGGPDPDVPNPHVGLKPHP